MYFVGSWPVRHARCCRLSGLCAGGAGAREGDASEEAEEEAAEVGGEIGASADGAVDDVVEDEDAGGLGGWIWWRPGRARGG